MHLLIKSICDKIKYKKALHGLFFNIIFMGGGGGGQINSQHGADSQGAGPPREAQGRGPRDKLPPPAPVYASV